MSKKSSIIVSIVFLILSIWLLSDLIKPEKTSTYAVSEELRLTENIHKKFKTDFEYGYELSFIIQEEKYISTDNDFKVIIKKNGEILLEKIEQLNIDRNNHLVYEKFTADSGDEFELIINGIDKSLIGKKAHIKADVTGGGPSVGLALARGLKPYFWGVLGILFLIAIGFGISGIRKKPAGNNI